jgi:hypothetical protein
MVRLRSPANPSNSTAFPETFAKTRPPSLRGEDYTDLSIWSSAGLPLIGLRSNRPYDAVVKRVSVGGDASRQIPQLPIAQPVGPCLTRHHDTGARDRKSDCENDARLISVI